jgi:ATP-binding cassette subfamily F protein 1
MSKKSNKKDNNSKIHALQTLFHDNITIEINGKVLINESELTINSNTKYFLVGHNGCGKTTLLNYIYTKLKDSVDILLIEQDIKINNGETIYDFILNANKELRDAHTEYEILAQREELTDEQFSKITKLQEYLNQYNWAGYQSEAKQILYGLGFTDSGSPVSLLSGGWRMRLALGKALLRKPQILLLDEPTNHLDLDAVIWLSDYLSEYKNSLITVSHQIDFINGLADTIWYIGNPELSGTKLYKFNGNYNSYIKGLELINKEVANRYDKFSKQIEQMKKKSIPKKDVEEFIKKNNVLRPGKPYVVTIEFPDVPTISSNNVIQFKNADFAYNGDSSPMLSNIDLSISMDSRYVLVGPNGSGKTTFFKLCAGLLNPTKGEVVRDERVRIGWFHQQLVESIPLDLTPIQYLKTLDSKLDDNKCRMYLSKIGLRKQESIDPCTTIINELSGGQKSRVAFSAIQIQEPNIILMDEPTNHLDIESIQGLINGINNYNGGILLITHDVHLIKSIGGASLFHLDNGFIKYFNGDFDEYKEYLLNKDEDEEEEESGND